MFKVAIDPGHGGNDPGAIGPGGLKEADVVYKIAGYLSEELERAGFAVMLTRGKDQGLDLRERGRLAAAFGADLFISEHINASTNQATGTEVYYSEDLSHTRQLAADLSARVAWVLGITDRGAKVRESLNYPGEDYYSVIDSAQDHGVPVVLLIESAFITNPNEEALLTQDSTLKAIARAQAKVISGYFYPQPDAQPQTIRLIIKGKEMTPEVPPQLIELPDGGHLMVPLRFIAEALGATVNWDTTTGTVTID